PPKEPQLAALERGLASLSQKVDQLAKSNATPKTYAAAVRGSSSSAPTRPVLAAQRQAQALRESIVQAETVTAEVANMTSTQLVQAVNRALGANLAKGARKLDSLRGLHRWAIAFASQEEKDQVD